MSPNQITLFLTEKSAIQAAWLHIEDIKGANSSLGSRIIPATMRDHDGSVDHGFKVSITKHGKHLAFL